MTHPSIPIGGTTGCDHEQTARIEEAAVWLASVPTLRRPRSIVPFLRERFGLSAQEAIEAIREGNLRLARAL